MIARPAAACFVGIDLHKDTLTACVLRGGDRDVSYKKIACKCLDQIRSFFASLPQPSVRRISELMRAPEFNRLREILESVPGVGLVTSATVLAEIGDFGRFPDSKAIGRYAGLTPTVYASGNSSRLGHISKTGAPDLRWVLQQAAWTAIRCDAGFKKTWLRIAKTAGKKAVAVAIARRILVLMWTLQRKDEPYKSRDPVAA